jgi:hypothetical protein
MNIKRTGARKSKCWVNFIADKSASSTRWDDKAQALRIRVNNVPDEYSPSRFDYEISLDIGDIRDIVQMLGSDAAPRATPETAAVLATMSHALLRLLVAASGLR